MPGTRRGAFREDLELTRIRTFGVRLASLAVVVVGLGLGGSDEPKRFVPPVHMQGGTAVVPAVFPDGVRIEVRYPRRLALVASGVRPFSSGRLLRDEGGECCGRDFTVFHRGSTRYFFEGRSLVERYQGFDGSSVEYWRGPHALPDFLVFHFGRWVVGVWDRGYLTSEEKTLWARHLVGRESAEGYLVLSARPLLRLARAGEQAGPELMLGDSMRRMVLLIRGSCRRGPPSRSNWFSSWCMPHAGVRVHVYGNRKFGDAVLAGLKIKRGR